MREGGGHFKWIKKRTGPSQAPQFDLFIASQLDLPDHLILESMHPIKIAIAQLGNRDAAGSIKLAKNSRPCGSSIAPSRPGLEFSIQINHSGACIVPISSFVLD